MNVRTALFAASLAATAACSAPRALAPLPGDAFARVQAFFET